MRTNIWIRRNYSIHLGGELNGMMTWPGEIHDEDLPGEMWVDWVRVVLLDNNKINE